MVEFEKETGIVAAAYNGNIAAVKELIETHCDIKSPS